MILIRSIIAGEEPNAVALVKRVFDLFEAPEYSEEGIQEFYGYITADGMKSRQSQDHIVFVAEENGQIIGVIEIRNGDHICLLFVDPSFHNRGIAKKLFENVVTFLANKALLKEEITVNSSPFAVPIYHKLGFNSIAEETTVHGIRFVPMKKLIKKF
jgi:GNAT superfamily N-acetyltransferase